LPAGNTTISAEARSALESAFGPLSERTIRAMAGALPSAAVSVTSRTTSAGDRTRIRWHIEGPPLPTGQRFADTGDRQYDQLRYLDIQRSGAVGPMINETFFIAPRYRKGGLGVTSFTTEVQTLSRLGVGRIETYAAREGDAEHGYEMNGFYTWPTLGYNGPLERWQVEDALRNTPTTGSRADLGDTAANRTAYRAAYRLGGADRFNITPLSPETKARLATMQQMGKPPTIQDLLRTPDGRLWWQYHGQAQSMVFNLQNGSAARKRLAAYLRRRRASGRPILNPATIR
jgi:hypothetical protein